MYPTGRNLLYTLNQALNPGFITSTRFLRYTRTHEDRTFKKYFKRNCPFTRYLRTGDARALFRYISHHRRQNDPVLKNPLFTLPDILQKIQRLRTRIIAHAKKLSPCQSRFIGRSPEGVFQPKSDDPRTHLFSQNEPNFRTTQNDASHSNLRTKNSELRTAKPKNEPNSGSPRLCAGRLGPKLIRAQPPFREFQSR